MRLRRLRNPYCSNADRTQPYRLNHHGSTGGDYEEHLIQLESGDRPCFYSDGIIEAMSPEEELFGQERLARALDRGSDVDLQASIDALLEGVNEWCGDRDPDDDVSVLGIEIT